MIRPFTGFFVRKRRAEQSYPRTAEVRLACVKARGALSSTRADTYHRYLSLHATARKEGKQKPGYSLTPMVVQQWPPIDDRVKPRPTGERSTFQSLPTEPGQPLHGRTQKPALCVRHWSEHPSAQGKAPQQPVPQAAPDTRTHTRARCFLTSIVTTH